MWRPQSRYTVSRMECRIKFPQNQGCRAKIALQPTKSRCRTFLRTSQSHFPLIRSRQGAKGGWGCRSYSHTRKHDCPFTGRSWKSSRIFEYDPGKFLLDLQGSQNQGHISCQNLLCRHATLTGGGSTCFLERS